MGISTRQEDVAILIQTSRDQAALLWRHQGDDSRAGDLLDACADTLVRLMTTEKGELTPDSSIVRLIEETAVRIADRTGATHGGMQWDSIVQAANVELDSFRLAIEARDRDALEQQVTARQVAEAGLCDAEIAKRQELDCQVFALKARLNEVEQMNAVLKYDWLALCGLRGSYIIAGTTLQAVDAAMDGARRATNLEELWQWWTCQVEQTYRDRAVHEQVQGALRSMIDPPPENVKYQGSWAWALSQMKAGRTVARRGIALREQRPGGGYYWAYTLALPNEEGWWWMPISEDFEATDWQLIESALTGESEANDE